MSLLESAFERCAFIDKMHTDDGEGGYDIDWREGAQFGAAIVLDRSIRAQVAQSQGVTGVYTVTVRRDVRIGFHEVFKRLSDGKIFRVTSKDDDETPQSSAINARTFNAEEWQLT